MAQKASRGKHATNVQQVETASFNTVQATQQMGPITEAAVKPVDPKNYSPLQPNNPKKDKEKKKENRRALKIFGITFGAIIGLLVIAYVAVSLVFMTRFMPNTVIGDFDVSLMSKNDAIELLDEQTKDYQVEVEGDGLNFTLSAHDAGIDIDTEAIVSTALQNTNTWMWPLEIQKSRDESSALVASYGKDGMGNAVQSQIEEFNESATMPKDATITYDEDKDSYIIVPEESGTAYDAEAVMETIGEAIIALDPAVKLTESDLVQPNVFATNPDLQTAIDNANHLIRADMEFQYGGSTVSYVGPDKISEWITLNDDLSASLDEAAMDEWAETLTSVLGTVGSERSYTRADGKKITVSGGSYGWEADTGAFKELLREGIAEGKKGLIDIPSSQSADRYTSLGERDWGAKYIDIDFSEQHARFYNENNEVIWESDIVSGAKGKNDTPTGVYAINSNLASPSVLLGLKPDGTKDYETPVDYWMPFIGNSIGLHDATWQSAFGGQRYAQGYGSHGCINIPHNKAKELWGMIEVGIPVVTHW